MSTPQCRTPRPCPICGDHFVSRWRERPITCGKACGYEKQRRDFESGARQKPPGRPARKKRGGGGVSKGAPVIAVAKL